MNQKELNGENILKNITIIKLTIMIFTIIIIGKYLFDHLVLSIEGLNSINFVYTLGFGFVFITLLNNIESNIVKLSIHYNNIRNLRSYK